MSYAQLVREIISFINLIIPAMFALIFVWLVWRIVDAWVIHAADPGKREEGRRMAITAVIVMVVAISSWGIVRLLANSFLL